MRSVKHLILSAAVAGMVALAGCEAAQNGSADRSPAAISGDAMDHYRAGDYEQAYRLAGARAGELTGARRVQAHYVAGMSAYQLGRRDDAIRHLRHLAGSRDPSLHGPVNATLGLIHASRGEHRQAITYFRAATDSLGGEDLAQTYYHLALSEQKLGRSASARTHFSLAASGSGDDSFRRAARQQMNQTGWTVQIGAFEKRDNADQHARSARSTAEQAGFGPPRVVPSTAASGDRLYLVQVGRFGTYQTASEARAAMGRTDLMIVPVAE